MSINVGQLDGCTFDPAGASVLVDGLTTSVSAGCSTGGSGECYSLNNYWIIWLPMPCTLDTLATTGFSRDTSSGGVEVSIAYWNGSWNTVNSQQYGNPSATGPWYNVTGLRLEIDASCGAPVACHAYATIQELVGMGNPSMAPMPTNMTRSSAI